MWPWEDVMAMNHVEAPWNRAQFHQWDQTTKRTTEATKKQRVRTRYTDTFEWFPMDRWYPLSKQILKALRLLCDDLSEIANFETRNELASLPVCQLPFVCTTVRHCENLRTWAYFVNMTLVELDMKVVFTPFVCFILCVCLWHFKEISFKWFDSCFHQCRREQATHTYKNFISRSFYRLKEQFSHICSISWKFTEFSKLFALVLFARQTTLEAM